MIVKIIDVEFSTELSVLPYPEPKKGVKKCPPVCIVCCCVDPRLAQKLLD